SQNALWQYIMEYFAERYSNEAQRILNTDTLDTQLQYSIRLYCYGTVGMTREWLLTDNITPAQTVVQMMFESMPEKLKTIFFN
ncbi:MAG: TetR family transcriptional regulator C-terminal domain-containing protein, partial [Butyrivibrio sp.]|nr:TetR family transcriptional regulator C-terminal domain-containing protein [Butyrivibrio sp.]